MLERRVQMGLFLQVDDLMKVFIVDVSVHTKQPLEDRLGHREKVFGKLNAYCGRKYGVVVDL